MMNTKPHAFGVDDIARPFCLRVRARVKFAHPQADDALPAETGCLLPGYGSIQFMGVWSSRRASVLERAYSCTVLKQNFAWRASRSTGSRCWSYAGKQAIGDAFPTLCEDKSFEELRLRSGRTTIEPIGLILSSKFAKQRTVSGVIARNPFFRKASASATAGLKQVAN